MKKRIASLLALALVLTLLVPALATANELSVEEKYSTLEDLKIFEGVDEDGTPALDENMNRAQAATILFRLLELVDPEVEEATYSDVPVDHWANAAVEAATQIEYAPGKTIIDGRGDGTFDPRAEVTLQELAALLVRALIYKGADIELDENAEVAGEVKDWARGYVAAAVAHGILPASDDYTVAATRGALASATYETVVAIGEKDVKLAVVQAEAVSAQVVEVTFNNGETLEVQLDEALEANVATAVDFEYRGYSYQVEVTWVVTDLVVESFKQSGVKKLTVEFNRPVEDEEVIIVRTPFTAAQQGNWTWNDDKTVGTFELNNIPAINTTYAVRVDGENAAEVQMVASVVTQINLVGSQVVLGNADANTVLGFEVVNQFGEKIDAAGNGNFHVYAFKTKVVDQTKTAVTPTIIAENKIQIPTNELTAGDIFTIYLTETNTQTQANGTYEVLPASVLAHAQFGTPVHADGNAYIEAGNNVNVPVILTDQHGNELATTTFADIQSLTVTPALGAPITVDSFTADNDKKHVTFTVPAGTLPGTYTVSAYIVPANLAPSVATFTFTVSAPAALNNVSFGQYDSFAVAEEALTVPYSAVNTRGEDAKLAAGTGEDLSTGLMWISHNPAVVPAANIVVDGDGVLKITPVNVANITTVTIDAFLNGQKQGSIVLSVYPKKEIERITGLTADAITKYGVGGSFAYTTDSFAFIDQYNRAIDKDDALFTTPGKGNVTLAVKAGAATDVVTIADNTVTANKVGKTTLVATFQGHSVEFEVEVITASAIQSYELEVSGGTLLYVSGDAAYHRTVSIKHGLDSDGNKVAVDQKFDLVQNNNPTKVAVNNEDPKTGDNLKDLASVTVSAIKADDDSSNDATLTFWKEGRQVGQVTFTATEAKPVVAALNVHDDHKSISVNKGSDPIDIKVTATDQYGVNIDPALISAQSTDANIAGVSLNVADDKVTITPSKDNTGTVEVRIISSNGVTLTIPVTVN